MRARTLKKECKESEIKKTLDAFKLRGYSEVECGYADETWLSKITFGNPIMKAIITTDSGPAMPNGSGSNIIYVIFARSELDSEWKCIHTAKFKTLIDFYASQEFI